MNSPLLNDLAKKDDDLKVISSTRFETVVETSLNIGTPIQQEEPETGLQKKNMGVVLQVIRHLFMTTTIISLFFAVFGIVPYFLLVKQPVISLPLFVTSLIILVELNVATFWFRDHHYKELPTTLLILQIFCGFSFVVSLSSYLKTMALLNGSIIIFVESLSVLIYNIFSVKNVNPYWAGFIMLCVGFPVWIVGMLKQQEYIIYAVILFLNIFGFTAYSIWHVANCAKYHTNEFVMLMVEFTTNFYVLPIKLIIAKKNTWINAKSVIN
jgi:hypothetical protein